MEPRAPTGAGLDVNVTGPREQRCPRHEGGRGEEEASRDAAQVRGPQYTSPRVAVWQRE